METGMSGDHSRRISTWVPIAFADTGFLTGFVAGLSLTPIVGILLPLLFGVIAGGSGFFAARMAEHSRSVGISLTGFALLCLLGSVTGIRLRQGIAWPCFWSVCTESPSASPATLELPANETDQEKLLRLLSIKVRLQSMDIETKDRELLFRLAKAATLEDVRKLESCLADIAKSQAALAHTGPPAVRVAGSERPGMPGGTQGTPGISMPMPPSRPSKPPQPPKPR